MKGNAQEPKDPISQAEEAVQEIEMDLLAAAAKSHAEMVLLTAVSSKASLQGRLMYEASEQGLEYLTGLVVAVGLTARNWARLLTGDPDLDPNRYINPESEVFCEVPGDGFAHYLVREIFKIDKVSESDTIREEMLAFAEREPLDTWGRMVVHVIHMFADLIESVFDVCNGDYVPSEDDDAH